MAPARPRALSVMDRALTYAGEDALGIKVGLME